MNRNYDRFPWSFMCPRTPLPSFSVEASLVLMQSEPRGAVGAPPPQTAASLLWKRAGLADLPLTVRALELCAMGHREATRR